jgi:dipeptidase E
MCFALSLSLSASMMSIEKATCHVLAYCEETGNILSAPLPTKWKFPIPVDEILDFPIPATASHLEALEEHVDTDFVVADDIAQAISEPVHNGIVTFNNNDHDETKVDDILSAVSQIKIVASGNERGMRLKPIVDKVVELSGTDLPKVLYVGTASFDRTDKFLQQTQAFRDMGCEIRRLDVSEKDTVPTLEEMREVVTKWADVIMGSGGNTLHALLRWKEVGLDLLMKEASLKGVVLCGGSAGAGCWFSSLHTDSLRPDNTKNKEHVLNELSEEVSSFLFVVQSF